MGGVSPVHLGIDSATRFLSLAVWSPERGLLAEYREDVGRDHAARIVLEIERLFARARIERSSVTAVGVGVGPGSYTGVRVGIATGKGLARAWGVPLAGAPTLAALALAGLLPGESGIAALDARRGNVYAARYRRPDDPSDLRLETLHPVEKLARSSLVERIGSDRVIEGCGPDAALTASMATSRHPVEALYL